MEFEVEDVQLFEKPKIYANKTLIRETIKELGYAISEAGDIIDKITEEPVKSIDGEKINIKEVGIIKPMNSPHVFIRNNLGSLAKFLAQKKD